MGPPMTCSSPFRRAAMCRSSRNASRRRSRRYQRPAALAPPSRERGVRLLRHLARRPENRIYRRRQRANDAVGAGPRFARREAPAWNRNCRVPVLVAGQPVNRLLHAFQAEGHPRCRGTVPRHCGRRAGKRRGMESRGNHRVLPKACRRSVSDSRCGRNAAAGHVAGCGARRNLTRLSAVPG